MAKVPEYNLPKFEPIRYKDLSSQEKKDNLYWRHKKNKVQTKKKAKLPTVYRQDYARYMSHLRAIRDED
jgi:hypothetical protein